MDYDTFRKVIGSEMDVPTDEQRTNLINGQDTIHVQVLIGYHLITDELAFMPLILHGKDFVDAIDALQVRGAERGKDYIISCYERDGRLIVVLHSTHSFLVDEDFDPSLPRD